MVCSGIMVFLREEMDGSKTLFQVRLSLLAHCLAVQNGRADHRRSKANLIDSRFAPAWIAFAHSFAYEGEHDHAITAYSTSARLFPGWVAVR